MDAGNKSARRKAIADWFMEISALLIVFPALDYFVSKDVHLWVVIGGNAAALTSLVIGVWLTKKE